MTVTVSSYLFYLTISISLTVWVAWTLHKHGRRFLVDSFGGDEQLADSVNHLLVVGFYLINIGAVCLALRKGGHPNNVQEMIEALSLKIGTVLLVLGVMHFINIIVFSRIRKRALLKHEPPPVIPDASVQVKARQS